MGKLFLIRMFIIFLPLQFIILVPVGDKGSGLRGYHVIMLLAIFSIVLLRMYSSKFPIFRKMEKDVLIYFFFVFSFSLIKLPAHAYIQLFLPFVGLVSYIIGVKVWTLMPREVVIDKLRKSAILFFFIVALKNVIYLPSLIATFSVGQEALVGVAWITAGGPNIEATVLVMLLLLFSRTRYFWGLLIFVFFCCVLYQSRTATIFLFGVAIFEILSNKKPGRILILGAGLFFLIFLLSQTGLSERFRDIGSEINTNIGRVFLWSWAADLISNNPFGYGLGMGIKAIEHRSGLTLAENNFHNIFLQSAVDSGVAAALMLLYIVFNRVKKINLSGNYPAFFIIVLVYFASGFVQFTGYDAIGWFFVGLADASCLNLERKCMNSTVSIEFRGHET